MEGNAMMIEPTLYNLYVTGCNVVNLMENDELILSKYKFNKKFRAELIKLNLPLRTLSLK
jgi:hypothetical protein